MTQIGSLVVEIAALMTQIWVIHDRNCVMSQQSRVLFCGNTDEIAETLWYERHHRITASSTTSPAIPPTTSSVNPTTPTPPASLRPTRDPVAEVQRQIKLDPSVFPVLTTNTPFESWNRTFRTFALSQGCDHVLDKDYVPLGTTDCGIFSIKQRYIYAVLTAKITSDTDKGIVREFSKDMDGQKAYQALLKFHAESQEPFSSTSHTAVLQFGKEVLRIFSHISRNKYDFIAKPSRMIYYQMV